MQELLHFVYGVGTHAPTLTLIQSLSLLELTHTLSEHTHVSLGCGHWVKVFTQILVQSNSIEETPTQIYKTLTTAQTNSVYVSNVTSLTLAQYSTEFSGPSVLPSQLTIMKALKCKTLGGIHMQVSHSTTAYITLALFVCI